MSEAARSRLVRLLKIALPLAAAALVAALFVGGRSGIPQGLDVEGVALDAEDGLRLTNPRFTGRTDAGAPFTVTAEWAHPDSPDPERVELGPLSGEIIFPDADDAGARVLEVAAAGGEFLPKARRFSLEGLVTAETSDGYRLTVSEASADLESETLTAEGPVRGEGPSAEIVADSLRAARSPEGYYVRFEGDVRVRIDPRAVEEGSE